MPTIVRFFMVLFTLSSFFIVGRAQGSKREKVSKVKPGPTDGGKSRFAGRSRANAIPLPVE